MQGNAGSVVNVISEDRTAIRSQGEFSNTEITAGTINIIGKPRVSESKSYSGTVLIDQGVVSLNADAVTIVDQTKSDPEKTTDTTYAINVDKGTLKINGRTEDSTPVLQVSGNLKVAEQGTASLTFSGEKSYLDGAVETASANSTVAFEKDAVWNVTDKSSVKNLRMKGGIINLASSKSNVVVENAAGELATVNMTVSRTEAGTLDSGSYKVTNSAKGLTTNVQVLGLTSDDMTTEEFKKLIDDKITNVSGEATAAQGDLYGKYIVNLNGDQKGEVIAQENTDLYSFRGANATALVQWRNQINHLTKRLGDLRASTSDYGAWARVYGKESKWNNGAGELVMKSTSIEVGGDVTLSNWVVGGAFNYTDSDVDLVNGDADGDSYGLALYASRIFDGGSFIDLIGRYSLLKNDLKAGNLAIDTKSNAFSLSAEAGHHFKVADQAYIEPQVEVTYGFVEGDSATAANQVRIDEDDYEMLITRIGARAGYDFPNNAGTVYFNAAYNYDFMGDADGTASKNGKSVSIDTDLGGGWWSYGIGAQVKLGNAGFIYGEFERTSGGDIKDPWAFNIGYRFAF